MAIQEVQLKTNIPTGTVQQSGSRAIFPQGSVGTSSPSATGEDLKKDENEKVTKEYVAASLNKVLTEKTYYVLVNGKKKVLSVDMLIKYLKETGKFSEEKLLQMTKKAFQEALACLKAALEDSVDGEGIVDKKDVLRNFIYFSVTAIRAGEADCSIEDRIEDARNGKKLYEGKSLEERLNVKDLNNQEELVKALEEYLNKNKIKEQLANAKTPQEKQEILKREIRKIAALLHGADAKNVMKVGIALLRAVKSENMIEALDVVADMLIPDGLRQKFINQLSDESFVQCLIATGDFTEDEIKNIAAYLGKNGSVSANEQFIDTVEKLLKNCGKYVKIEQKIKEFKANHPERDFNSNPLTQEEIQQILQDFSQEEVDDYNKYNRAKAALEGNTAGVADSTDKTEDEKIHLIQMGADVAKTNGFYDEYLEEVKKYLSENSENNDLSTEQINAVLDKATNNDFTAVTGGVTTSESSSGVVVPVTQERAEQAAVKADELKQQILAQSEDEKKKYTVTSKEEEKPKTNIFTSFATDVVVSYKKNEAAFLNLGSVKEIETYLSETGEKATKMATFALKNASRTQRAAQEWAVDVFGTAVDGSKRIMAQAIQFSTKGRALLIKDNRKNAEYFDLTQKEKDTYDLN